jgi:hypothetical protein
MIGVNSVARKTGANPGTEGGTCMARVSVSVVTLALLVSRVAAAGTQEQTTGTCIAIALPAVQGVEGSAVEVGNAVRELFTSYLAGPAIRVVALDVRLASQAPAEAQQKGCGHVLTATLTRKRSGGGMFGRILGQAGSSVAWQIPGGGVGAAVVRGVAVAGAAAVSDLASTTKAKDEMTLEYRVTSTDGRAVLKPKDEKLKASFDREDLLTPLVQRASESIVAALSSSR